MKTGRLAGLERRVEQLEPEEATFDRIVISVIGCRYEGPPILKGDDGAIPMYFLCAHEKRECRACHYFDPTYSKEREAQATT